MQQLVDDGGLRLAGCVPQPPDPVAAEKLGDGPLPGHAANGLPQPILELAERSHEHACWGPGL